MTRPGARIGTPRHRSVSLAAGVALALLASACASGSSGPETPSPSGDRVTSAPAISPPATGDAGAGATTPPAAVPDVLDFEAALVGGGTLEGAELAGAPVAVWFWAPW